MTDRLISFWASGALIVGLIGIGLLGWFPVAVAVLITPLLVVVPGGLLLRALRITTNAIGTWLMYSVASTFGLLIPLGLVLNALPPGLEAKSWSLGIAGITLLLLFAIELTSRFHNRRLSTEDHDTITQFSELRNGASSIGSEVGIRGRRVITGSRLVMMSVCGLLLVGAFTLSVKSGEVRREFYTQMFSRVSNKSLQIVVQSDEKTRSSFKLDIRTSPAVESRFALNPGESKVLTIPMNATGESTDRPIAVELYKTGTIPVYRSLRLYPDAIQPKS